VFLGFLALLVGGLLGRCGLGRLLLGLRGSRSLLPPPLLGLLLRLALRFGGGLLLLLGALRCGLRGVALRLGLLRR
jgi:hypothetical protein